MTDFLRFKTSSPAGDLLSLLPSIRQLYRLTNRKAIIYQALNVVGDGYPGVHQAFTNERGESIMMAEQTFKNLIPLLKSQEYIEDVIEFIGQKVDYDMDEIRLRTFTNQDKGSLHRVPFYVFPEMACDLSEKWLDCKRIFKGVGVYESGEVYVDHRQVIINFTPRFRNNWINYYFLKEYQHKLLFAGLPKERDEFCKKWLLNIPLLETKDFYELAVEINSCKFFMSNQTGFWQIAEGLKVPRLLETCQILPHVIPIGANGFDFYHQIACEYYFKTLVQ